MFDMFGPSVDDINEANKQHGINHCMLMMLLINKGIITYEDVQNLRPMVTAQVDQIWASKEEKQRQEFDEEYPGVRELFGEIFGKPE